MWYVVRVAYVAKVIFTHARMKIAHIYGCRCAADRCAVRVHPNRCDDKY